MVNRMPYSSDPTPESIFSILGSLETEQKVTLNSDLAAASCAARAISSGGCDRPGRTISIVAQQVTEDDVLALLAICARRVVQDEPARLATGQGWWQVTDGLGAVGAASMR